MKNYILKIGKVKRQLPIVSLGPKIKVASFNLLGDREMVEELAKQLYKKIKGINFDYLVGPEVKVVPKYLKEFNLWSAMQVHTAQALIKIEPNLIARGSVFSVEERTLVHKAQELFERSMKVQSLSFADIYGSKLCAV